MGGYNFNTQIRALEEHLRLRKGEIGGNDTKWVGGGECLVRIPELSQWFSPWDTETVRKRYQ
jgi:hypothetical protein